MIEITTTIKGGLPVIAKAQLIRCPLTEYPGCDYIDDLSVFWLSGKPCHVEISCADDDRLAEELLAAACQPWEDLRGEG